MSDEGVIIDRKTRRVARYLGGGLVALAVLAALFFSGAFSAEKADPNQQTSGQIIESPK